MGGVLCWSSHTHRPSPPTFEHGRVFAIVAVPAFLIAWPIARSLLDWLVNGSGLLPSDIEPITTSPLDVVLIQLRTAVALVSIVLGGLVLLDLTRFAAQSDAVRTRMDELDLRRIRPTRLALGITSASVLLLATGAAYSLGFLTPFLLEYFSSDASDLGVDVAWTIPAFVGFVVDLTLASSIGFLTPVLTWTVLRLGILERSDLTRQRRAIWFSRRRCRCGDVPARSALLGDGHWTDPAALRGGTRPESMDFKLTGSLPLRVGWQPRHPRIGGG